MAGGVDAHLVVGELDALFGPGVGETDVELDHVEVEGFEAGELALELGFGGGGDHHGVVDALAVDGLAGVEDAGADGGSGFVAFVVLDGAVGVVGDAAEVGDAVDEPEAAHAGSVVDAVVGVWVGVALPEAGEDGALGASMVRVMPAGGVCWRGG